MTPLHNATWADLDDDQVALVMEAIRNRVAAHADTPGMRYSQVIVNSGREAGASIEHPHAQLLGMPFVPRELLEEQAGFSRFAGNCLLCATLEAENDAGIRIVHSSANALAVCPYWSAMPYEMLVIPRLHDPHLHTAAEDDLTSVGIAIRDTLGLLRAHVGDVAYNVVFHAAPYKSSGPFHWHVHIWPKVTTFAGFELGTGVMINIVAPEIAAEDLRSTVAVPAR